MAVALPVLTLITNVTMVAVIWRGGIDVSNGRLSVGELIAFVNYLLIGMAPLLFLSNLLTMVTRANVSVERVYEILDTESQLHIADEPYRGEQGVRGEIVFEDVTFQYDLRQDALNVSGLSAPPGTNGAPAKRDAKQAAGHEEVLRGVSFAVAPGQQVALLGATGSGKSTLTSLVPRFYDVSSGRVLIDGIDVRSWDAEALRRQIGGVMQQPTLFHGTIYDNIAYGRADATMEEVVAAAVAAQAHDFILEMADQYESVVEARGANLSGGQKQRIAIARALLISPAILILDDSTSAVDFETEVRIQNALDALMKDRTTLIVAQRISSVLNADQIFVLDQGRIAAQGTHRQLISSSPIYQEIYTSQLGAVV